uniref:WAP domain-containing protein n=1 Tax=Salarias fasciatus TaxID=181472 RepID=A0A672FFU8_SALFA
QEYWLLFFPCGIHHLILWFREITSKTYFNVDFSFSSGKPGQCPQADLRFGKKCRSWWAGCSGDDQCSGIRKCCRIGCRYLCITPGELWIK